jgi:hypothetical protein
MIKEVKVTFGILMMASWICANFAQASISSFGALTLPYAIL